MISLIDAAVGCLIGGSLLWVWSVARRDVSVVDAWWGVGFVGVAWFYRRVGPPPDAWHLLHLAMVTLWGIRLGAHIAWRSRGDGEDHRYAAMRTRRPKGFWWRSLFTVFFLQALLLTLLSYPLYVVQSADQLSLPSLFGLGSLLWVVGFFFEAVADFQMLRFKNDPSNRGRVLDRGLWRLSRHPNYFGESLLWWGFGAMAVAAGSWWALAAPLLMTFLLLGVSGVSLLEKTITSRRPEYREYQERTNAFLPGPPQRGPRPPHPPSRP